MAAIPLTRTQAGVAAGMAGGFAATFVAFFWPNPPDVPAEPEARIAVWIACSMLVTFWLLIGVASLARHRFFTPEDIEGGGLTEGTVRAKLLQTLVQNTLEQCMLAIPAYSAWLWLGPAERGGLAIVCACLFSIGRLLFFAGYSRGAPWRALGFTLTFYPTVGLYVLLGGLVLQVLFA